MATTKPKPVRNSRNGAQAVRQPTEAQKAPNEVMKDEARETVAADAQNDAAEDDAPTIVRVSASRPARVIVERIEDRERRENGSHPLEPNRVATFLVSEGQSLRVVEGS